MSSDEKKNRTQVEFKKIADFGSRWNDVLRHVELPEVTKEGENETPDQVRGAGGESEAHKALKEFVRQHPEIVDAGSDWDRFTEYPLPTLDQIDVLFKSRDACIAVEVKSIVSDACPVDYRRGIYQAVKYDALLRAMAKCSRDIPSTIKSVLVVETTLPRQYSDLAKRLGVHVYENVGRSSD
jgi:hypothetical protein